MTIQKLTIYNFSDIKTEKVSIKHQNAFIFPDGTFCLSQGYVGTSSSSYLESAALRISREIYGISSLREFYNVKLQELLKLGVNKDVVNAKKLYYLRDILIQYHGLSLFARIQRANSVANIEQFWDYSILPKPEYFGKTATDNQLKTLHALFEINNDGSVLPNWNITAIEEHFQKRKFKHLN